MNLNNMNLNLDLSVLSSQARGLHNFINEIRGSTSKDEERARVDKELANIRAKFVNSSQLSSYQKKKYIWKLCYIYMLGYEVNFGHVEFISLISAQKYQEKTAGYMAASLILKSGDELMTLVINSMRNDLIGRVNYGQCLALAAVANIGGVDLSEALVSDVQQLVLQSNSSAIAYLGGVDDARNQSFLIKKACLCLLRLWRNNPNCLDLSDWTQRIGQLLECGDNGIITSALGLLVGFATEEPHTFEPLIPYVISLLTRLVVNRNAQPDYTYFGIPCPWIQVKCLKFLQFYSAPPESSTMKFLYEVLERVLIHNADTYNESVNKSNTDHSVLFEAINLVISYGTSIEQRIRNKVFELLGRFITAKDSNIRYLGLDAMTKLFRVEGSEQAENFQEAILESLRHPDVSIRKRALELVFVITDSNNYEEMVGELIHTLETSDSAMKEEMVVKIAILAEKFSNSNLKWYVDVMVQTVLIAGDYVAEAVWHRIVLIVTNHDDIHEYAAEKLFTSIRNKWTHDTAIALSAYLLGEVGFNICEKPGMSGFAQFAALNQHFPLCSAKVQGILLTCYVKLLNLYSDIRDDIVDVFKKYSTSSILELQQRSCEYLALPNISADVREQVLNAMPPFSIEKENSLLSLNEGPKGSSPDKVKSTQNESSSSSQPSRGQILSIQKLEEKTLDLLALDDDDNDDSNLEEKGVASDLLPKLLSWLNNAIMAAPSAKSGLYKDDSIVIFTQKRYKEHHGQINFSVQNVSGRDISGLTLTIPEMAHLSITKDSKPLDIAAGSEVNILINMECKRPFAETPSFELSFTVNGLSKRRYQLRLPVTSVSFFDPVPSDKDTYMQRWKLLDGSDMQEIFTTSKTVDQAFVDNIRTNIFPLLHLGLADGLDASTPSATGSAAFKTGTQGPDGQLIQVGVMTRIEADIANARFRVTIRSKNQIVATALMSQLKTFLS